MRPEDTRLPRRLDREVIYESDWICLYADRVETPGGAVIPRYHQLHYPHESVCVVVRDGAGRYLLIRNRRYITQRLEWETVAGRIETGEAPEEAARRECLEETGCTLRTLIPLCRMNPANGMSDMVMHYFLAQVEREGDVADADEVADKRWFTGEELRDLLRSGEARCGVANAGLMYALLFCPPET